MNSMSYVRSAANDVGLRRRLPNVVDSVGQRLRLQLLVAAVAVVVAVAVVANKLRQLAETFGGKTNRLLPLVLRVYW